MSFDAHSNIEWKKNQLFFFSNDDEDDDDVNCLLPLLEFVLFRIQKNRCCLQWIFRFRKKRSFTVVSFEFREPNQPVTCFNPFETPETNHSSSINFVYDFHYKIWAIERRLIWKKEREKCDTRVFNKLETENQSLYANASDLRKKKKQKKKLQFHGAANIIYTIQYVHI